METVIPPYQKRTLYMAIAYDDLMTARYKCSAKTEER